jgi:hypothetical protein
MNYYNCFFQIARGNTARYVYVFINKGNYYEVTKKYKLGGAPYRNISTIRVNTTDIQTYINTVVALTY